MDSVNSSSTTKSTDSSATDYLITKCENLLESDYSKYDECNKHEEELRLQLIKRNGEYEYLRLWLKTANKDCLEMKSNDGHLTQIYKTLLKNNFVSDFADYGLAREKLNLKLLNVIIKVNDLRKDLSGTDAEMTSLKPQYQNLIERRALLLQTMPVENYLEYAELEKALRLKLVNVMYECERLSTCLNEACKEILKLTTEHDDLTRCYRILSQNSVVKEFLDSLKDREKLPLESAEKLDKSEYLESSHHQVCNKTNLLDKNRYPKLPNKTTGKFAKNNQWIQMSSMTNNLIHSSSTATESFLSTNSEISANSCENDAPFNLKLKECEEKLIREQRRREQVEKEYATLDKFSDKLCCLLLEYQNLLSNDKTKKIIVNDDFIQNSSTRRNSIQSSLNAVEELSSDFTLEITAPELQEEIKEEMGSDEDEFPLHVPGFEEGDCLPTNEEIEKVQFLPDHHSNPDFDKHNFPAKKLDLPGSGQSTKVENDCIDDSNRIEKPDLIVENKFSSSSATQKHLSITKVKILRSRSRSHTISPSTNIKNSTDEFHEQTENEWFRCLKCQKRYKLKRNEPEQECPTCSILDNIIDPTDTKSTIDDPTFQRIKNDYVVKKSSKSRGATYFRCNLCDRCFPSKDILDQHNHRVHKLVEKSRCPVCRKMFLTEQSMNRHTLIHTSLRPYKCSLCHKYFSHSSALYRHIRVIHKVDPSTLKNRKENRITRSILKKNQRIICTYGKVLKNNLRNVQNAGNASRKNSGKTHNTDSLTKNLQNIDHSNKGRYCCAHCGQRFHQKQNMFHHICTEHFSGMLVHFKCISCEHVFPTKQLLTNHRQAYHYPLKMPNKCSKCNACFKRLSSRVQHEKYFHQNND